MNFIENVISLLKCMIVKLLFLFIERWCLDVIEITSDSEPFKSSSHLS